MWPVAVSCVAHLATDVPTMTDTRRKRFNTWFFPCKVPKHLIEIVGKKIESESLGTGDLRQARYLRDITLGELRSECADLERQPAKRGTLEAITEVTRCSADECCAAIDHSHQHSEPLKPHNTRSRGAVA